MYITPALVAGCLALQASAFLVPLEVSEAAEQAKSELATLLATTGHTVDLDCPGCPYYGNEDGDEASKDIENKIRLNFNINDKQSLAVNEILVSPLDSSNDATPSIIFAPQIRVEDGRQTDPLQLDYTWEKLAPITFADEADNYIETIKFTILGLQGYPVKVDTVAIDLLHTPEQTIIARIETVPFEETPGAQTCDTDSKWSLCRFRAILIARLQAIMEAAKQRASFATKGWGSQTETTDENKPKGKGCGRKGPGRFGGHPGSHGGPPPGFHGHHGGPPPGFPGFHGGPPPGFRGGPHHGPHGQHGPHPHGHHGHHGHHRFHHFGHMLHQTLRFFVIPALLGVIGGLMASAVGMLVGHCISYLWIRFHRGGVRGNASAQDIRVVEIIIDEEEKDVLISEEAIESPPEYKDVEVSVEEKH
ncbi:hypothetical protein H2200_010900 [Cladophialophora chaetospira]|uniref:DUF7728 domain-containing protein n=1 Tax=Cladophialophora chaetospira TaxID=386627 RepID=A0AA38X0Y5_9EURO|nr:hypothetical protein H2200_010900 [Cladophialophora chaetospira]